jgi:hypothetical protein
MKTRDPEANFERLWQTFHRRYPFFDVRKVDWDRQFEIFRRQVTADTTDDELWNIFRHMLGPLRDGHVELSAKGIDGGKKRYFNPEKTPRFEREFSPREIKQLKQITNATLADHGFSRPAKTEAWMLRYCRSSDLGYLRILELEGVKKRRLRAALDGIARDFKTLKGFIIDLRNNPGGDDSTVLTILNRFCDSKRVAFRRTTKAGPGPDDFTPLKTWYLEPQGELQFTGRIVLLTCDAVFSGAEVYALAAKQLPYVTIVGEHTNGVFSYQLEKKLPNGWKYRLSYQVYLSADGVCYEAVGVPPDIELLNRKSDIENGVDPLITRAIEVLSSNGDGVG